MKRSSESPVTPDTQGRGYDIVATDAAAWPDCPVPFVQADLCDAAATREIIVCTSLRYTPLFCLRGFHQVFFIFWPRSNFCSRTIRFNSQPSAQGSAAGVAVRSWNS